MLGNSSHIGFTLDQGSRGKCRASEDLLFIGYGLTDRFALEIEAAVIHASLEKSPKRPVGHASAPARRVRDW